MTRVNDNKIRIEALMDVSVDASCHYPFRKEEKFFLAIAVIKIVQASPDEFRSSFREKVKSGS